MFMMFQTSVVALVLIGVSLAGINDGRCGPRYDNYGCPKTFCCSKYEFCGNTPNHCNDRLEPFVRSDGRCGPMYDRAPCPIGSCCSSSAFCGTGPEYCGSSSVSTLPSTLQRLLASTKPNPALSPAPSQTASTLQRLLTSTKPNPALSPAPSQTASTSTPTPRLSEPASTLAPTPAPTTAPPSGSQIRPDRRCGLEFENAICPSNQCCSKYGYCGTGPDYCLVPLPLPSSLTTLLPKSVFNSLVTTNPGCEGPPNYTYENFIQAASAFPAFGNDGSIEAQKRDIAAFLAHVLHESGDMCYINELAPTTPATYCAPSQQYPCYPGANYHGRGPFQLSWNYNYIEFGKTLSPIEAELIYKNPDALGASGELLFRTALWFYMNSHAPKGMMHAYMIADTPNFGQTINIINGGLECNGRNPDQVSSRVRKYLKLCDLLGVNPGASLYC